MSFNLAGAIAAAAIAATPAPGLVIDFFAGGGGASTGIESGLGFPVDIAINHDASAIAMHMANHPSTRHYTEDVYSVDPEEACGGRDVDFMWLSPDCTHFSKARGRKPVDKKIRSLPNVAVKWVNAKKPRQGLIMENVEEIEDWGPLIETPKGLMPCPERKGEDFQRMIADLRAAGATSIEWRTLRASDYGAPTIRRRLFLIARYDGLPIVWPEPTHGAPDSEGVKSGRLLPFKTAADCIDWSVPCPSIWDRKAPLVEATCRRIAAGIVKFVLNAGKPFIVPVTHTGGDRVHSLDEPLRTVTTAHRGEFALVEPRFANADRVAAFIDSQYGNSLGVPADRPLPTVTSGGSGKQALVTASLAKADRVAAFMAQHNGGFYEGAGNAADSPLSTLTGRGTQQQLVTASLVKLRGTGYRHGQPIDTPLHTLTAGGQHMGLVYAFLCKYYGDFKNGQSVAEPLHTVTTKDRFGLVTVTVEGEDYVIVDIGMRMLTPRELARAQGFRDTYELAPVCHYETDTGRIKYGPLPKTHQIARIGNSVCPIMAEVLTRANFAPKIQERLAA